MCRDKEPRSQTAVLLSGTLRAELPSHAHERVRHFFMFLYYAQLLTDYANTKHGKSFKSTALIKAKATDQVDTGMRSKNTVDYDKFDDYDANVVDWLTTTFTSMDAAHFCNLGIDGHFQSQIEGLNDELATVLLSGLKALAGNTRLLPQRVNIGPDWIIDILHYDLALQCLNAQIKLGALQKKLICKDNIIGYLVEAKKRMTEYLDTCVKAKKFGVAACAQLYIDCYSNAGTDQALYGSLYGGLLGDCQALFGNSTVANNYFS